MSTMMKIHSIFQLLENTIAVPLKYMEQIVQLTRVRLKYIPIYANRVLQFNNIIENPSIWKGVYLFSTKR